MTEALDVRGDRPMSGAILGERWTPHRGDRVRVFGVPELVTHDPQPQTNLFGEDVWTIRTASGAVLGRDADRTLPASRRVEETDR